MGKNVYTVRRACIDDLPGIEKIYASARAFMAANGNPNQWGSTNPPSCQLEKDIEAGNLYLLCVDHSIHGVFAFILGEDPTYQMIYEGCWRSNMPYGTIHRVASDGSGGVFSACVAWCRVQCSHLRVDTHRDNLPMQRSIERAGFQRRGIIHIADGSPRIAYDLI